MIRFTDIVAFVRDFVHDLEAGFRPTLEEAREARWWQAALTSARRTGAAEELPRSVVA